MQVAANDIVSNFVRIECRELLGSLNTEMMSDEIEILQMPVLVHKILAFERPRSEHLDGEPPFL